MIIHSHPRKDVSKARLLRVIAFSNSSDTRLHSSAHRGEVSSLGWNKMVYGMSKEVWHR